MTGFKHPEPLFVTTRKGHRTRILTPTEYDSLTHSMTKLRLKTIFEILMWSGMRYVELQRLHANPEWVLKGRNVIHLPYVAQKKVKRSQVERYIHIVPQISNLLPYFFDNKKPSTYANWHKYLQRTCVLANLNPSGVNVKTTRKTIESWMIVAGIPVNQICLWQGHDHLTSMNYYQGLAFTDSEKNEIQKRLSGW